MTDTTLTLVSFLGKNTGDPKTGYRTATYRFPDGAERATPFFGLALADELKPDRIVILGTAGSMWDVLVGHLAEEEADDDIWEQLMDAAQSGRVGTELLERARPQVARRLGRLVDLRLIPYGRDGEEQTAILQTIAEAVPNGRVVMDLTHGFRHLAALGLLSAFFLERMARLDVAGLYYGALDMTQNGITPVVRLDGLLAIQRWIDALDRFDQNGDYGVFAPLLIADGVEENKARYLEEAAFHERTFNLSGARQKLSTFLPVLDKDLPGTAALFQKRLAERLAWVREGKLHEHQRKLAYEYLKRGDFVRATVFGWEALVTRECDKRKLSASDFKVGREPAAEAFEAEIQADEHPNWMRQAYWTLKNLRNALAHGNPPSVERYRKMLKDSTTLQQELESTFKRLLG